MALSNEGPTRMNSEITELQTVWFLSTAVRMSGWNSNVLLYIYHWVHICSPAHIKQRLDSGKELSFPAQMFSFGRLKRRKS
ncbi:hypothetical protein GN956_G2254 [Arapaima gigas]